MVDDDGLVKGRAENSEGGRGRNGSIEANPAFIRIRHHFTAVASDSHDDVGHSLEMFKIASTFNVCVKVDLGLKEDVSRPQKKISVET